ncbi:hypothetical protein PEDI_52780 [Persicobacter diffluens]|uniref:Uncharacterized protein n=2 Tax=Persicobacter diffluens TaxID=981 RepID=A0AAN4W4W4_9BACT|nr:hypothetical protein PEDI_52780 [Persicobacter diffluens]
MISCSEPAQVNQRQNLYWPGDFENAIYGGNFSRAVNVTVDNSNNYTKGGNKAWHLIQDKYQHLEILTTELGEWKISFMAKSENDLKVIIKPVFRDEQNKQATHEHEIDILGDNKWHPYELSFKVENPYPGPMTGELLVACYNDSQGEAWIDNLALEPMTGQLEASFKTPQPALLTDLLQNNSFEEGTAHWESTDEHVAFKPSSIREITLNGKKSPAVVLAVQPQKGATKSIGQKIDASSLAGKSIRVSAEVSFLTLNGKGFSWHGFLLDVHEGDHKDGKIIPCDPSPNWLPMGLAAPVGESKRSYGVYQIPAGTKFLYIELKTLPKMADNLVAINNVSIEVL